MTEKKKFFFDINNFDEHADEISEEELAFIEREKELKTSHKDELLKTKNDAYEQGKKDGYEEARQSLEQKITLLLENAKHSFMELQANEQSRENRYEEEAAHLGVHVFKGIYPAWSSELGLLEIEAKIKDVLHRVTNQKSITIEITSSLAEELERRLEPIKTELGSLAIQIEGKDHMEAGDFRMAWKDGGAVRDTKKLATRILEELKAGEISSDMDMIEENLAETEETRHNEEEIQKNNPPASPRGEPQDPPITTDTSEQSDE